VLTPRRLQRRKLCVIHPHPHRHRRHARRRTGACDEPSPFVEFDVADVDGAVPALQLKNEDIVLEPTTMP